MRLLIIFILVPLVFLLVWINFSSKQSGAPPFQVAEPPSNTDNFFSLRQQWKRPPGPPRVALQIGHLNTSDTPDELSGLRNNTGASGGGKTEVEINQKIAELTAEILKAKTIEVDLLPVTIPPNYWADVFVAIHADGSLDNSISGFKTATPWRDLTGNADTLLKFVSESYASSTEMSQDPNITRNMRGYYAFAWWRYKHAIHPMTTAIILETGFLSSPKDRKIIVNQPELSATGLADGIVQYLKSQNLIAN